MLLGALALTPVQAQQPPVLIPPGAPLQVELAPTSASTQLAVDVPEGARQMRLSLRAANPAQRVDLYARYGTPFELRGEGVDPVQLRDQAQYKSTSSGGDEFLVISDANPTPLAPGRWYVAVINWSSAPTTIDLQTQFWDSPQVAPIEVRFDLTSNDCSVSAWSDASPRSPVRGNSGGTLGQQRQLATQEAARLLTEQLRPRVPIRVQACWGSLGPATGNSFTLANAGPTFVFLANSRAGSRQPGLERPYTWYAAAAAAQQLGTDLCRISSGSCTDAVDIRINFNLNVDSEGSGFDYGFTHAPGAPSSFISVAMHEISHGLGVFGLVNLNQDQGTVGAQRRFDGQPYAWDDIYGSWARWTPQLNAGTEFLRLTDAERVLALSAGFNLRFAGPNAVALNPNGTLGPPASLVSLHAPSVIAPGSTYSHIANGLYGPQLMTANISAAAPRELGIALGILRDVGFTESRREPKQYASAPSYQYFDPARNGHGIDFRLISPAITGRDAEYFMGFYTFDAEGAPEWYIASGPMVDGVFVPAENEFGDSLLRMRYTGPDQSVPEASSEYVGRIRVDFNGARMHPVCLDGNPGRNLDGPLAVMSFQIGNERLEWCMQPVVMPTNVQNDFSSIWYSLGDGGWGLAIQSFDSLPTDGLFSILYYADAQGLPRWAIAQEPNFQAGATYPLRQVRGYCRTCPAPAELALDEVGNIRFGLVRGGAGSEGNTVSFDLTYPGPQGGRFARESVDLFPNSDPAPAGD